MSDWAVQMDGVCKHYAGFDLDEVNLRVAHGGIMGFVGANGAGKSTTLRLLMGLTLADRGEIRALGLPMPQQQEAAKRQIGFVSDDMRLYAAADLRWHMDFVRRIQPGWDERYAQALLRRFDLRAGQRVKGMSHGQRVKAALLLALARRPRLLVLDEPSTGLDPVARADLIDELAAVLADESRTVVLSSHNTQDVEQLADQIVFIDAGRIIDDADKESYLERWRRLRLQVPDGVRVPDLPGLVGVHGSGRLAHLITQRYAEDMPGALAAAGLKVTAVERLTLEEIFISTVRHRRALRGAHTP